MVEVGKSQVGRLPMKFLQTPLKKTALVFAE